MLSHRPTHNLRNMRCLMEVVLRSLLRVSTGYQDPSMEKTINSLLVTSETI